ncbi:MAG: hypothetical protein INR69_24355 [Mucilaginibacter polytrichastri]|nr:hypothetical protein [Mucilaginibacter polytrichastri]
MAIINFIRQKKFTGIFNGVAPSHPLKQVFYTEAIARFSGSAPASFADELSEWKQIEPENLHKRSFQFRHPDLLEALGKDIW